MSADSLSVADAATPAILIVDDRPANLVALEAVLAPLGQTVVQANSGEEALRLVLQREFAVILLDVQMPGLDGFETAKLIRNRARSRHIPIVFITAIDREEANILRGYAHGAVDYLVKPYDPDVLRSKVNVFVSLFEHRERTRCEEALVTQRRSQSVIRRSEERYRSLVESTSDIVWHTLPSGEFAGPEPRWEAFTGQTETERRGMSWLDAVHPEDRARSTAAWLQAVERGALHQDEHRLLRQDGEWRYMTVRAVPVREASGEIREWIGLHQDITERRRGEEKLRFLSDASRILAMSLGEPRDTLNQVARLAADTIADCCTIHSARPDGTLELMSVAHRQTDESSPCDCNPPEHSCEDGPVSEVARSGRARLVTLPDESGQGMRTLILAPMHARGTLVGVISLSLLGPSRRFVRADLAMAEELARRAAAAAEHGRLFQEAQAAVRVRDEFLSVASHELRTPLTALQLKLTILRQLATRSGLTEIPSARVDRESEVAMRQVKRLSDLIEDLLDVSRIIQGRFSLSCEDVDLAAVVQEASTAMSGQALTVGSELRVQGADGLTGYWDKLRLEQVVSNLLSNAIKYGAGKPIDLSVVSTGDEAILTVSDQGIGIGAEYLPRIFEKFERAVSERNYGGLGLGLYISRQIVEALGGTIQVESQLGRGSTFTVRLPRVALVEERARAAGQAH